MKRRNPLSPAAQQSTVNEEFTVGGAYAFLLRVSSFFGVAPLRFRPHGNGYFVSISIPMCIYSYILITVLAAIAILIMFLQDYNTYDRRNASHISYSKLSEAVSKCELILFFTKAAIGVFGAPGRMICMLKYMNAMALVDRGIDAQYSQMKEGRLRRGLVFFSFFISMFYLCYIIIILVAVEVKREWTLLIYNVVLFIVLCLIIILQLQISFTVMSVYTRFKAINQILTNSTSHLSVYDHKVKALDVLNILAIRVASSDAESETVVVRESGTGVSRPVLSGSLRDTVQRIAMVQGLLYDVVHNINKSYGLILVLTLTSLLIHIISTVYFAILKILSDDFYYYEVLLSLWFFLHLLTLFMLVEPCHYTTAEGKKTESIVNRMIMESPPSGPLASRLELFARQLMLQRIGYEPMGFFSLNRTFVLSMFGIVVTYLVILLQFQD